MPEWLYAPACLVSQRFDQVKVPLLVGGHTISAQTNLRKACDLMRKLLCGFAGMPFGNDTIAETHGQRLLSADRATRED
jgi:hypothetical protein